MSVWQGRERYMQIMLIMCFKKKPADFFFFLSFAECPCCMYFLFFLCVFFLLFFSPLYFLFLSWMKQDDPGFFCRLEVFPCKVVRPTQTIPTRLIPRFHLSFFFFFLTYQLKKSRTIRLLFFCFWSFVSSVVFSVTKGFLYIILHGQVILLNKSG